MTTANSEINEHKSPSMKEQMIGQMLKDTSHAVLAEILPATLPSKVEAEATWWKSLAQDNLPGKLPSQQEIKDLEKRGWTYETFDLYSQLSHVSADGKTKETDKYSKEIDANGKETGVRMDQDFVRADNKEDLSNKPKQFIDVSFQPDGVMPCILAVRQADYKTQFDASFDKNGNLKSAEEHKLNRDYINYDFYKGGSLSKAVTLSGKESQLIDAVLFEKNGELLSDWDPRYVLNKIQYKVID